MLLEKWEVKKKRGVKNLSREEEEIINSLGKPKKLQSFSGVPILCSNISSTLKNHLTEVKLKLGQSNILSRIKHVGRSCIWVQVPWFLFQYCFWSNISVCFTCVFIMVCSFQVLKLLFRIYFLMWRRFLPMHCSEA